MLFVLEVFACTVVGLIDKYEWIQLERNRILNLVLKNSVAFMVGKKALFK